MLFRVSVFERLTHARYNTGVLPGTPTTHLPHSHKIRMVLSTWFVACVILNCFFNTTMISYNTHPGMDRQLESTDDIIASKIDIVYYYGCKQNNNNIPIVPVFLKFQFLFSK